MDFSKAQVIEDRKTKANKLRDEGLTYREIGINLGVSRQQKKVLGLGMKKLRGRYGCYSGK